MWIRSICCNVDQRGGYVPVEVVMVRRVPPALGTRAGARAKALKGG